MTHARLCTIDRAQVDAEAGTFRAVLFTDGEASDGHILSIAGGSIPERMPLFVNHQADPRTQLGSLYLDKVTEHQVVVRGEIMLSGEGAEAEIRRDLMAKLAAGHVWQMSGRWDADDQDVTFRDELPEDHPAHVGPKKGKKDWRFRKGRFFSKWHAKEGSIVGLGADAAASMREWARDDSATPAVREFWERQAEAVEAEQPEDAAETAEAAPEASVKPPTRESKLAALLAQMRELELEPDDVLEAVEAERELSDPVAELRTLMQEVRADNVALRAEVESLRAGGLAAQTGPHSPRELVSYINEELEKARTDVLQTFRAYVDVKRGERQRDERTQLVDALLERVNAKARRRSEDEPAKPLSAREIAQQVQERAREAAAQMRADGDAFLAERRSALTEAQARERGREELRAELMAKLEAKASQREAAEALNATSPRSLAAEVREQARAVSQGLRSEGEAFLAERRQAAEALHIAAIQEIRAREERAKGRVPGDPSPPPSPRKLAQSIKEQLQAMEDAQLTELRDFLAEHHDADGDALLAAMEETPSLGDEATAQE